VTWEPAVPAAFQKRHRPTQRWPEQILQLSFFGFTETVPAHWTVVRCDCQFA
jgi:hypothetical protein